LQLEFIPKNPSYKIGDIIELFSDNEVPIELLRELMPWRKGPFKFNDIFIDSEWRSYIKWNSLVPHLDLKDKEILDVGGNNGYYAFRMLEFKPKSIDIIDPSPLFYKQFLLINSFIKSEINYHLIGVEDIQTLNKTFDVIFCMGVLYHRRDPITTLKLLKQSLKKDGYLILDTLILEGTQEMVLSPLTYAKMSNVYFIPTLSALMNWIKRAKFKEVELIGKRYTTTNEQRKTEWINSQSLNDFLKNNEKETIEGYQPPLRCYLKLKL